jgi:hypothetical protein
MAFLKLVSLNDSVQFQHSNVTVAMLSCSIGLTRIHVTLTSIF